MTPIESIHDARLVALIGVAINVCESLALEIDKEPNTVLAEHLFLADRYIQNLGTDIYINKLCSHYPLLEEAIK